MSERKRSWWPTNKWWAAQCTGIATLAVAWVNAGGWTKPLAIAAIGFVSQATAAYLVSNADPGAAPTTEPASDGRTGSTTGPVGVPARVS